MAARSPLIRRCGGTFPQGGRQESLLPWEKVAEGRMRGGLAADASLYSIPPQYGDHAALYLPCLHRAEPAAVAGACAGVA